jgi:hypothetical protein
MAASPMLALCIRRCSQDCRLTCADQLCGQRVPVPRGGGGVRAGRGVCGQERRTPGWWVRACCLTTVTCLVAEVQGEGAPALVCSQLHCMNCWPCPRSRPSTRTHTMSHNPAAGTSTPIVPAAVTWGHVWTSWEDAVMMRPAGVYLQHAHIPSITDQSLQHALVGTSGKVQSVSSCVALCWMHSALCLVCHSRASSGLYHALLLWALTPCHASSTHLHPVAAGPHHRLGGWGWSSLLLSV